MDRNIKYIKDTEGNDFFPVAHEKGVVDDNGTTLESKLQSKQDAISDLATIRSGAAAGATAIQSLTVGTTTTGAAGSSASVTNSGTATAPVLSFTIPQGEQGVKGDTVIMGGESSYTLYNTTGDAVDGAMTQQAVTRELTELAGEVTDFEQSVGDAWKIESQGRIVNGVWNNDFANYKHIVIPIYSGDKVQLVPNTTTYYTVLKDYPKPVAGETPQFATGYSDRILLASTKNFIAPNDAKWLYVLIKGYDTSMMPSSITINGIEKLVDNSTSNAISILSQNVVEVENELALGAVYDVSAKNPTAGPNSDGKWESLSALLSDANLNTLIPTSVRKGGMSVKFVQSSDNKYVQYRYMLSNATTVATFTNTANWQGVDVKPEPASHNTIESGGVYNGFDERPIEKTDNVLDVAPVLRGAVGISEVDGVYVGTLNSFNGKEIPVTCEAGSYTISYVGYCEGNSTTSGSGFRIALKYSDNTSEIVCPLLNNVSEFTQIYANSNRNKTLVGIGLSFGSGSANIVHIKEIQLRKGTTVLPYIPPYCAADYNGRALAKEETTSASRYNNVSAYFSGPNKPVVTKDGDNIVVTLPSTADNSALRIYDNSGNLIVTKTCSGEIFTLSTNEALIMSGVGTGGGTLSKVSRTSVGNNFVLLYNSYASIGGLLSKYYVISEFNNIKNVDAVPTKDSHKFMDSDGINKAIADTAYFSGPNKPVFSTNGISLIVEMPTSAQTADLRIYDKKGNIIKSKRCAGEIFTLNLLQALVLNDDSTFAVVQRTTVDNKWILVENTYPSVGGLLAKYYNEQRINEIRDKSDILNLNPYSIYSDLICNLSCGKRIGWNTRKIFFSFLHYSDIHGKTENVERLMKFKTAYNDFIHDVICSGDIVEDDYEDNNILSDYQSTIAVIGNHDSWVEGALSDFAPEIQAIIDYSIDSTHHVIKQKSVYDKFLADNIGNWNVIQPSDAATVGKCYFYKDYTNNTGVKLRLIFLDCMHYNVGEDIAGGSSAQNAWLESVLTDAKTNSIPVAICVHYFPTQYYSKIECSYTNTEPVSSDYLPSIAINAVNAFIHPSSGTGGEFICWFVGHCHCDVIGKSDTYQDQVFIAVDTARHDKANLENSYRGTGLKSQDAFNLISFDTESKLIKIVRVGSDTTRELKLKRRVVYRYAVDGTQQPGLILSE